jgi:hypothetical protein
MPGHAPLREVKLTSTTRFFAAIGAAIFVVVIFISDADARGRTGSHRAEGYTSHGKGSHYVGGH